MTQLKKACTRGPLLLLDSSILSAGVGERHRESVKCIAQEHNINTMTMAWLDPGRSIQNDTKSYFKSVTFLAAVFVLLKNKSFSTGTGVTADSVHTFILASAVFILAFILIFKF